MTTAFSDKDPVVVNTTQGESGENAPAIAHLADGTYVITWQGSSGGLSGYDIFAQRYDAGGNKIGGEIHVNTDTDEDQVEPSISALIDGGFVVAWASPFYNYDLYEQRFDASGNKVGSHGLVNTYVSDSQESPVVQGLAGGGSVTVWVSEGQDADDYGVYSQRYDATGNRAGAETRVNTTTSGAQYDPDVAALQDGSYVVTWTSSEFDGPAQGIFAQHYSSAGVAIGGETRLDSDGSGSQARIAVLADGSYVVAWLAGHTNQHGQEGHARHFAADGQPLSNEMVFAPTAGGAAVLMGDIAALSGGGYVIAFMGTEIYFQRLDAQDHLVGPQGQVTDDGTSTDLGAKVAITALADDGFALTWTSDDDADNTGDIIYQKVVLPSTGLAGAQYLYGTSGVDTLDGGAGADIMSGLAGDDTYKVDNSGDVVFERVGEGDDTVMASITYTLGLEVENLSLSGSAAINATGNAQDNSLIGNSAANVLKGLAGNDTYTVASGDTVVEAAGEGNDTVNSAVTFSLFGTFVETLNLTGAAAINATGNSQDNTLNGNAAANTLTALAGNDTLDGKAGADVMLGGFGNDTYLVDNAGDVVTELKDQGNDTVFSTVTFSLANSFVETLHLMGSNNINATGNSQANTLIGNDGNNILNGGYGHDSLTGGLGADTFLFGTASGADTITDFNSAQGDSINVHAYLAHNTAVISESGGNTTIDLGGGNIITVTGATAADVQAHIVW